MTNELRVVELYGENSNGAQTRYLCASAASITKGTILMLSDPRTAATSTGTGDVFAGIASMDKDGTDNSTSISAWNNGVFEAIASLAIVVGQKVKTAAGSLNQVMAFDEADGTSSYAIMVGTALETAADGETINIKVNN